MTMMRDSHKLFLQSFMSRGLLDAKEVKMLFKITCEKFGERFPQNEDDRKNQLQEFVRTINQNIRPFHMEIKKGVSEDEGSSFYCLICTINESPITRLASTYTQQELEYFKKLIEYIVDSETGVLGSTAAVNLVDKLPREKRMTKNDAQALQEKLENSKWIIKDKNGKISLGTRTLLELEQYILEVHEGSAKKCELCNRLCVMGQTCYSCGIKLHLHCASRLFHNKEQPKCPQKRCNMLWMHDVPKKGFPSSSQAPAATQSQAPAATSDEVNPRKRKARP